VLWAVRKPIIESGHHVALNPSAPEAAAEAAVHEAIYAYSIGRRSVSMSVRGMLLIRRHDVEHEAV
jgi:hypothetical protein